MKKIILFSLLLLTAGIANAALKINKIEPSYWFAGMKEPSLQLMVYGNDVRDAEVTIDDTRVRIDSIVRLDSPDYLLVYLNLKEANAGTLTLRFKNGGRQTAVKYALKPRVMSGDERKGFSNADVLYMLMPDRFASGDTKNDRIKGLYTYTVDRSQPSLRHGGDLEGIRKHLDYFTQLGVTALWFTPILENNTPDTGLNSSYHGYATTDYYRVDPRFGTNEAYKRLIDEAHSKGLKIVMDMIFNHCDVRHPWCLNPPSKDWFNCHQGHDGYLQTSYKLTPVLDPYASQVDMRETVDGWFVSAYADLNQRNPHVMKYLTQNSVWWIESAGIDGIRMDTYPYADRQAMAHWMKTLDTEYPHFNVVGETWVTEPAYTAAWQKDSKLSPINSYLKSVMDFSFFEKLSQAKKEETDAWWEGYNRIYNSLVYDYLYTDPSHVMAFIENHDTDRFLGNGRDTLALKQALALLLTINRTPQLYYGTEILMNGTKERTDGDVRRDFPGGFPGDSRNAFTREGRTPEENAMFDWMSRLLHWRQGNDVITKGRQTQFIPHKGVYVVARQHDGCTVLTILNGTSKPAALEVARYAEVIGKARMGQDVLTGRTVSLQQDLSLAPRETLVLEVEE
ncbi:glycoside hydrolase family 13 protein [Hoylesella marshii]|uniref:Alpha amylase, catalytic domain protein n=1 Tax=Hoylesella marshii DSM 16973 = JCM 13450 TaxID=862515 RepID=E0NU73_9BACT|nr:glycoside hydrolase family 13 protein [Hoylesella marshii]EFM01340.1 alpha amylase, catalytic domain protein [Hoylesella marshii DSM 16973 = JCM 13450]